MYFWNSTDLKHDLARGTVTEAKAFPYLVALLLATGLQTFLLLDLSHRAAAGMADATFDKAFSALSILITLIGIFHIWRCNGAENGRDFFIRFFTLGWVVLVKTLAIGFVIGIAIILFIPADDGTAVNGHGAVDLAFFVLSTVLAIAFFVILGNHLDDLNRAPAPAGEHPDTP